MSSGDYILLVGSLVFAFLVAISISKHQPTDYTYKEIEEMTDINAPKVLTVILADTHVTMSAIVNEQEWVPYGRRTVQIELTPEQRKAIERRHTGYDRVREMYEVIVGCWFEPDEDEEVEND